MITTDQYVPAVTPCVAELSNEEYHEGAGISSSGLKLLARTPAHFWAAYLDPKREKKDPTPALVLGDQLHCAVLEPSRYFQTYYPLPEKYNRATKQGKEDYAYHEKKAEEAGQILISADSHEICQRIAEAVHESAAAAHLFGLPAHIEQSIFWKENVELEDGQLVPVLCKVRPDIYFKGLNLILDIKSAEDAGPKAFTRAAYNYGYHISAAFYRRGVSAMYGVDVAEFLFAAFEKVSPYAFALYRADAQMLAFGDAECTRLLKIYAQCVVNDDWPGYPPTIETLSLPKYAYPADGAA